MDHPMRKDAKSHQREECFRSPPIQCPKPMLHAAVHQETPPTSKKPPIKPRRTVKCRSATKQETGPATPANQNENKSVMKRMAPSLVLGPIGPLDPLSPSLRAHTLLWFERTQLPLLRAPGKPLPCWLHGFATRREAELLLQHKQQGCFMVRLSESKIGFVLSYRGEDRCRHFIIEEEESRPGVGGQYLIVGENSRHGSLGELIAYYTHNPVGPFNEKLTVPYSGSEQISMRSGGERDRTGTSRTPPPEPSPKAPLTDLASTTPPTNTVSTIIPPAGGSAHYAVVKKILKKTNSFPMASGMAPHSLEDDDTGRSQAVRAVPCGGAVSAGSEEPQYARVNKPPRVTSQRPPSPGRSPETVRGAAAVTPEQKYWELEPQHTYEETPYTRARDGIHLHDAGRQNEGGSDADCSQDHLYSEVNLRGLAVMETMPPGVNSTHPVSRTTPCLPIRPLPRSAHCAYRSNKGQRSGDALQMTPPLHSGLHPSERTENSVSSIYEQIPERPANSGPPPPAPNPKR